MDKRKKTSYFNLSNSKWQYSCVACRKYYSIFQANEPSIIWRDATHYCIWLITFKNFFQEMSSMTCPRSQDVSFKHVFTYQYRSDLDPNTLDRTLSDLCLLSSFRCNSNQDCWLGRKCCSVKSRYHNKCKLCIFAPWKHVDVNTQV